jgi:hypothetical protein
LELKLKIQDKSVSVTQIQQKLVTVTQDTRQVCH